MCSGFELHSSLASATPRFLHTVLLLPTTRCFLLLCSGYELRSLLASGSVESVATQWCCCCCCLCCSWCPGQAEAWEEEAEQLQATITQLSLQLSAARLAAAGRLAAAVQVSTG
jgi:hypothetical protein